MKNVHGTECGPTIYASIEPVDYTTRRNRIRISQSDEKLKGGVEEDARMDTTEINGMPDWICSYWRLKATVDVEAQWEGSNVD